MYFGKEGMVYVPIYFHNHYVKATFSLLNLLLIKHTCRVCVNRP